MIRASSLLVLGYLAGWTYAAPVDFDREVAPLLAGRCLNCHAGDSPKGDLDLSRKKSTRAVLAAKLEDSTLWQRVHDDEMPPKHPLSAGEKAILRRWIEAGAKWGTDPIDPFRVSTQRRAGYDWWSLQPLQRPVPPQVRGVDRARSPIDRFLLARLEARGLSFSFEADRRTLIRRLSFDLTGLPPTPESVAEFVEDPRPDAYERLVDRFLASPAYGERFARFWLDLVRFGESDGYERDLPRFNSWPYRDWVVRALNADLPYDEFARLQLAGDVLRGPGVARGQGGEGQGGEGRNVPTSKPNVPTSKPNVPTSKPNVHYFETDGLAATGFLVAGPRDVVLPVGETMRMTMRQDELEDVIGTVGQTFLGMTIHCARCHDHKFDPVSQKDYYRLVAALSGIRHGERSYSSDETQILLAKVQKQLDERQRQLAELEAPIRRQLEDEKRRAGIVGPRALAAWDFTRSLSDLYGRLHVRLNSGARQTAEGLVVDGKTGFASTGPLPIDLRAKTLEAWVKLPNLDQRGGGVVSVQTLSGNVFDAIVYGEEQPRRWLAGSEFFNRTQSFKGAVERNDRSAIHVALTYAEDGTITAYRDGKRYGTGYRSQPFTFRAGKSQVVFGLRHSPVGGNKMLSGTIVRARLYDRALTAEEVARSAGLPTIHPDEIPPRLDAEQRRRHDRLRDDLRTITAEVDRLQREVDRRIYAVNSQPIGKTHVLLRGNVTTKGEVVQPQIISALTPHVSASISRGGDQERRRDLAEWITHVRNPLFARVMVNRLWQTHFGIGLVDTPSDFGFNGSRPTHPELLDWLASELIQQRWSLKALHRQMLLSSAYRQSSRPNPGAMKLDADNRLIWRKSPQRLEAEAIRDAILSISGSIDRTMGGAPYLDFKTYFFKGTQFYDPLDEVSPEFHRRSLYRMWARGGRNPLLDTLDCPDPSATTPRRAVTTTPLQALAMLNNAFVLDQAERFAARLRAETAAVKVGDVPSPRHPWGDHQIQRAYELALSRTPDEQELPMLRSFVDRHGLAALARVIFNTNEFVQVE